MRGMLIIGMMFLSACAIQAKAEGTVDVVHLCKSTNIDAATAVGVAAQTTSKAAQEGAICIAYVNAVIEGYSEGSVTTENYITGYLANQLSQIGSTQSAGGDKASVDKMNAALLSATKGAAYDLCLPKDPASDTYPRVVAAYIQDQKILAYPTPALLVIRAVQSKYSTGVCASTLK